MLTALYFFAVWLMAGLVTGLTSFGSNLIAVPLLSLTFPARESILMGCVSAWCIFMALALIYRRAIAWRETVYLTASALLSIPAGAWFLKHAGSSALLLGAGIALILFLAWQCILARLKKKSAPVGTWFAFPMGIISGALMGGVGMGGPPLVLFAYLRNYDTAAAISTINAASAAIMLAVLPWQYADGLYTAEILGKGLMGGFAALLGILASIPLVARLNIALFRKLLLVMLALSALSLLARAFAGS